MLRVVELPLDIVVADPVPLLHVEQPVVPVEDEPEQIGIPGAPPQLVVGLGVPRYESRVRVLVVPGAVVPEAPQDPLEELRPRVALVDRRPHEERLAGVEVLVVGPLRRAIEGPEGTIDVGEVRSRRNRAGGTGLNEWATHTSRAVARSTSAGDRPSRADPVAARTASSAVAPGPHAEASRRPFSRRAT